MKIPFVIYFLTYFIQVSAQQTIESLPEWKESTFNKHQQDWLLSNAPSKAAVYKSASQKDIILYNGLLKRVFRLQPNLACTDFTNVSNGQQLLRAVKPEARLTIDGVDHNIGGLHGQKENAYLRA